MTRARIIFDVLGARTTHVGKIGAGQVAKVANQVIVGLTIGRLTEAYPFSFGMIPGANMVPTM